MHSFKKVHLRSFFRDNYIYIDNIVDKLCMFYNTIHSHINGKMGDMVSVNGIGQYLHIELIFFG